jgi:hypothetical protein
MKTGNGLKLGRKIEHRLRILRPSPLFDRQSTMMCHQRLKFRNPVVGLIDIEHLLILDGKTLERDRAVEKQEVLNAIRKTVGILQKPGEQFKNKELGDLRKELETLLGTFNRTAFTTGRFKPAQVSGAG